MHPRLPPFPRLLRTVPVAALLFAAGCAPDYDSTDETDISNIYADMKIVARSPDEVNAVVDFRDRGADGERLQLSESDSLWLSRSRPIDAYQTAANSLTRGLADSSDDIAGFYPNSTSGNWLGGGLWGDDIYKWPPYRAEITAGGGDHYYIGYISDKHADALHSHVTLPPPFAITAPLEEETVNRANPLVVKWHVPDPHAERVKVRTKLECEDRKSGNSETLDGDPGAYTFPGGDVVRYKRSGDCPLTITVVKTRNGTVDEHFRGGKIIGRRATTVTVSSTD